MKKTVQIVTIPLDKEGWNEGDIKLCVDMVMSGADSIGTMKIATSDYPAPNPYHEAQQLLVLSDDEIIKNDYFYHGVCNKAFKATSEDVARIKFLKHPHRELVHTWVTIKPNHYARKIIASYPQLPGTLPISKETVQAWIDSGTPGEGSVEMVIDCRADYGFGGADCCINTCNCKMIYKTKGNLLLEFGKKIIDTLPYPELVKELSKYYKDTTIVDNPSIPTDEEIEEEAIKYSKEKSYFPNSSDEIAIAYQAGYKQALKDLGHE